MRTEVDDINSSDGYKNCIQLKWSMLIVTIFLLTIPASAQEENIEYYGETYVGESFNFEKKTIRFKEVLVDSRCPSDVTCVRAGEAKIMVEIFTNGDYLGEETISVGASPNSFVTYLEKYFQQDYAMEILSLSPYPKISRKIKASDYQLQLKVTEILQD